MKKLFLFITLFAVLPWFAYGQDSFNYDTIFKIDKEQIICSIKQISDIEVTFTYPKETLTNSLAKNIIKEIHFSTGRIQKFTTEVIINGEQDWEKVKIIHIISEVAGLANKGEVKASISTVTWGTFSNMSKILEKAYEKMKRQAAILGAHMILYNELPLGEYRGNTAITGTAYGYK